MIAEYAATYGGLPSPDTPLPLFWALASRIPRFEARALLRSMQGVAAGAADVFGGHSMEADLARDRLMRLAYPLRRQGPRFALEQPARPAGGSNEKGT
ncbi:MAG TPA: hypothetical protein VF188_08240 [Longimicrobiales bacterium]